MRKTVVTFCLGFSIVLVMMALCNDLSWAAQEASDNIFQRWMGFIRSHLDRPMWDLFMRWVNFLILTFVIVKYARAPVAQFLREKKAETSLSIRQLEDQKQEAELKIQEGRILLQSSQDRLVLIKERIVAEGQKRKEQIIADARRESQIMMETARVKIDSQIREAAHRLRVDLIDKAAQRAEAKLPQIIAQQDHHRLVNQWMDAAHR